jgi:hypothetical protein
VSKRERHDSDRRGDRRDSQPEDDQQRRQGTSDGQEGDSLTALKAILAKVAALLNPLHLSAEESIKLVEQLYGKVLETDLQLAGETDDTRKSSVLAAIQNATIRREGERVVVDYASAEELAAEKPDPDRPEAAQTSAPATNEAADAAPAAPPRPPRPPRPDRPAATASPTASRTKPSEDAPAEEEPSS